MPPRPDPQAGYTFLELVTATAIFALMVASFGRVFSSSSGLSASSRAALRAHEENRRSLAALSDVLRGAAWDTLAGFAADQTSTTPSFHLLLGSDAAGRLLDTVESVEWRSTAALVNGVTEPGEVVVLKDGQVTRLAPRVPRGGFSVVRQGNTLEIHLVTYYATREGRLALVTGEASVSLRN